MSTQALVEQDKLSAAGAFASLHEVHNLSSYTAQPVMVAAAQLVGRNLKPLSQPRQTLTESL